MCQPTWKAIIIYRLRLANERISGRNWHQLACWIEPPNSTAVVSDHGDCTVVIGHLVRCQLCEDIPLMSMSVTKKNSS